MMTFRFIFPFRKKKSILFMNLSMSNATIPVIQTIFKIIPFHRMLIPAFPETI